jgi:hypothetical protein
VLWVHNDSGDSPRVFAVTPAGVLLGVWRIAGARAVDWEDIAVGPGPAAGAWYLYLGDIGDNRGQRRTVSVYRVPEPSVVPGQAPVAAVAEGAEEISLRYPDGPRDAEALMVDPRTGDIYVVSKSDARSRVYRAAYPQSISETITMELVATLPWGLATAGDVSPDGSEVVVRGYVNASLWQRARGTTVSAALAGPAVFVPLALEPQGESLCFDASGDGYYTVSEGKHQPLYWFARAP